MADKAESIKESVAEILGTDPSIASVYKALRTLKGLIEGEDGEVRRKPSMAEASQVIALQDMNRNIEKLNRSIEWLTAAVIVSCADDPRHALVETNKMAYDPALGDGGLRFRD